MLIASAIAEQILGLPRIAMNSCVSFNWCPPPSFRHSGNPMIFSAMVMSIEHPWDTVVLYCEKIHTFGALGPFLQFCLHADKAYHCRLINALHLKRTLQQNALPGPHGDSFGDLGPLFMIWVRFFSILDYYQKGIVKISFCPRCVFAYENQPYL